MVGRRGRASADRGAIEWARSIARGHRRAGRGFAVRGLPLAALRRDDGASMSTLRILVTGATGFLGGHLVAAVQRAGHVALTASTSGGDVAVDLTAPGMIGAVVEALRPDVAVHLAALSSIAACERDPSRAQRVNAWLAGELAERFGARLLFVSTDLVFDGRAAPYDERSPVGPLSVYGASKVAGEERVWARGGRVARLPLLFGADAHGRGASASLRQALAAGRSAQLYTNEYRTPLGAGDAAKALLQLVVAPDGPNLVHLPGPERVSRWQLAQRLCTAHRLPTDLLQAVECADPLRPRDVSLAGALGAARDLDAMLRDA